MRLTRLRAGFKLADEPATAIAAPHAGGDEIGHLLGQMDIMRTNLHRVISQVRGGSDAIATAASEVASGTLDLSNRTESQASSLEQTAAASEVRSLAGRSAEAAREIKTLITDSVDKVGVGTHQVAQAGATMQEIVSGIQRVADIVGEIASASREQSTGLAQINQAVTQLDSVTQQNAALVEETSAASSALQEQARDLATLAASFKLDQRGVLNQPAMARLR